MAVIVIELGVTIIALDRIYLGGVVLLLDVVNDIARYKRERFIDVAWWLNIRPQRYT